MSTKRIWIATYSQDYHALAVAEALRLRGADATLWYTTDFPHHSSESVEMGGAPTSFSIEGAEMSFGADRPDVVWYRRVGHVVERSALHPADVEFAMNQCARFRRGLFQAIAPEAFWVNPPDAVERAEAKVYQHARAIEAGLDTPPTLYSNDPARIRDFLARHGGRAVYKPLVGHGWRDGETKYLPYTGVVTTQTLVADRLLAAVPGIYQALVPKAHELRVTFMGRRAFAARILSQETEGGRLDWRKAYHELRMEPDELPGSVHAACLDLMDRLGIVFGCFDFIVTPEGRYVFLEVNQAGQWLFIENYTRLPLLDAFAEFLIQGRPDFEWDPANVQVRLGDVDETVHEWMDRNASIHVDEPDGYTLDRAVTA